jgi:hypothetical protein
LRAITVLLSERPLFTREYENPQEFCPDPGSVYLYGVTSEPRSEFAVDLLARSPGIRSVELRESGKFAFETDIPGLEHVFIRRRKRLEQFVCELGSNTIYLDITGLSHSTWAPLVRVLLELNKVVRVIYLEPATYNVAAAPDSNEIYDLSEQVTGIEPIPLFTNLSNPAESQTTFVALLGFEGARFSQMLNEFQPDRSKIFPVIGVPGFRLDYPFDAYVANALPLEQYKSARNLRFAKSNCPFSLFYALEDVAARYSGDHMRVGLIGTKPHALGAILFAISRPQSVEIVYDHVKRKSGRTQGAARCLVYGVSEFLTPARRFVA